MAQLPNIIEQEKGLFSVMIWVLKKSYEYQKKNFSFSFFFIVLGSFVSFFNIIGFSKIVDLLGTGKTSFIDIAPYLILLFLVEYLPTVIEQFKTYYGAKLARETREAMEDEISIKIATIDIATIEQPEFGDLLMKAQRGIGGMASVRDFSFSIIRDFTSFIIASIILIKVLPVGFIILFCTMIPTFVLENIFSKKMFKIWDLQIKSNRSIEMRLSAFRNKISLIEIKFYNVSNFLIKKIQKFRLGKNTETDEYAKSKLSQFALANLLAELGSIVTIAWVIFQVIQGTTSLGALTLIWGTISRFSSVIGQLFRSFGRLPEYQAHVLKLYSLLYMENYIDANTDGKMMSLETPKIEFKNVSFAYPESNNSVLKNLSFVIEPKQEVALVGLNGAGKTTLFRLLSRIYDPTEGEILINNIPLKDYNLDSWRKSISIMNQDYKIFQEETIKENIIFDSEEHLNVLDQVTKESGSDSYISNYNNGLDQLIGNEFEGGIELSKGQNQKLVLARALYRNTPVLILDEPTAAIDALSEDHIFKALRNNHKDQTRIIISHKFSNVRDADNIILIEHGKIIEQGNHTELMKLKEGKYKELFELQAEGYK